MNQTFDKTKPLSFSHLLILPRDHPLDKEVRLVNAIKIAEIKVGDITFGNFKAELSSNTIDFFSIRNGRNITLKCKKSSRFPNIKAILGSFKHMKNIFEVLSCWDRRIWFYPNASTIFLFFKFQIVCILSIASSTVSMIPCEAIGRALYYHDN